MPESPGSYMSDKSDTSVVLPVIFFAVHIMLKGRSHPVTEIRNKTIEGLKTGDSFSISRTFTEQDVLGFADITRDYNPVHFDERFSKAKNFTGGICHGLLVGSMLTEIGGQIGVLASQIDFSFKRPVYFGDTITCVWTFTDIDARGRAKAVVEFKNQNGQMVITATAKGILPNLDERAIMKAMVDEGDPTNKLSNEY